VVWPGVVAGAAAALLCGALSVPVVARRMAFMTQGVSHAAMAGAGVAALVGAGASGSAGIVALACLCAAFAVGVIASRGRTAPDTAVGVVLVASMAAGALMLAWRLDHPLAGAPRPPAWESLLFGSVLLVRPADAATAVVLALAGCGALWMIRRPLIFTTASPGAARASGVRDRRTAMVFALLVGVGVVVAVKLVGVVLATALLVLPGAGALRVRGGLRTVVVVSIAAALVGMLLGLLVSFETDAPPGASAAAVLTLWWMLAAGIGASLGRVLGRGSR